MLPDPSPPPALKPRNRVERRAMKAARQTDMRNVRMTTTARDPRQVRIHRPV